MIGERPVSSTREALEDIRAVCVTMANRARWKKDEQEETLFNDILEIAQRALDEWEHPLQPANGG